jgi:serpin B
MVVASLLAVLAACADEGDRVVTDEALFEDVEELQPAAPATSTELSTAVGGVNALGFDLLRASSAAGVGGNVLLAPWSVAEGLALPYLGAAGDTRTEMSTALHIELEGDRHHAALAALREQLRSRQHDDLEVAAANRVFAQDGLALLDPFLANLSRFHEAPLATVDFGQAEVARSAINEWVAEQTRDRITELFPPGAIDAQTQLALVNAVWFKASWYFPFNGDLTKDEPFTLLDGRTVLVPTMHFNEYLPSGSGDGYSVVQLPYSGEEMSMLVIVPDDLPSFVARLDARLLAEVRSSIRDGGIHLGLPRFELRHHTDLIPVLQELGMVSAFSGAADFSGITGSPNLFIDAIEHETYVKVDEEGTEAAAATGSAMQASHGPTINVNRPFVFLVQDDATGAVLFLGAVVDPAAE